MTRPILVRPAARQDLLDARAWYEQQRAGLGGRFVEAVATTLETVAAAPERFPRVRRDVRRALVRSFPYGVFYRFAKTLCT